MDTHVNHKLHSSQNDSEYVCPILPLQAKGVATPDNSDSDVWCQKFYITCHNMTCMSQHTRMPSFYSICCFNDLSAVLAFVVWISECVAAFPNKLFCLHLYHIVKPNNLSSLSFFRFSLLCTWYSENSCPLVIAIHMIRYFSHNILYVMWPRHGFNYIAM